MWRRVRELHEQEEGAEIIEFLGLLPFLLMVGLIIVQFMFAGQTIMVALSSAREGARAAVVCENIYGAVARASPGFAPQVMVTRGANDIRVTVGLQVPTIDIPYVNTLMPMIYQSATMRREKTRCSF
jgi:hypothetical protein